MIVKLINWLSREEKSPIYKYNETLWIMVIEKSVIQFNIELNNCYICFYVEDNENCDQVGAHFLESMVAIAFDTSIELVFDKDDNSYSLLLDMSPFIESTDIFIKAIDDLLWAHRLISPLNARRLGVRISPVDYKHGVILI
ncbi:hypothetical protein [Vibrio sp. TBV020]|uniref:hypothetical protein n=1 Tax=Vibrio sp. TBV020 TaxID=3137398 RepID=UPI0038CDA652